ncbi:MAG TPA: type II secretion system protein GspG [Planctomycetota bacterium]|nr:type II secretion system protein GspG [Planctomycetota bacterium]
MGRWMLVTGALGLLAACGYTPGPEVKETRETMVLIVTAITNYKKDVGKTPAQLQMLVTKPPPAAPEAKKWKGPYLKEIPNDAWGKPFMYTVPGKMGLPFDLISLGADGKWGGKKDDQDIAYDDKSLPKR